MGEYILGGLMLQMRRIQIFLLFYFYSFNIVFEGMPPAALTSSLTINVSKQVNQVFNSLSSPQRLVAWDSIWTKSETFVLVLWSDPLR